MDDGEAIIVQAEVRRAQTFPDRVVAKWRVKGRRSEPKMRIGEGQFAGLQID